MAYTEPPLHFDSGVIATSGVIGTTVVTALLAGGDEGIMYRLVAIQVTGTRTVTGRINATIQDDDTGLVIFRALDLSPDAPSRLFHFPEPGIVLGQLVAGGDSIGVEVSHNASVASQGFVVELWYYVDRLTA